MKKYTSYNAWSKVGIYTLITNLLSSHHGERELWPLCDWTGGYFDFELVTKLEVKRLVVIRWVMSYHKWYCIRFCFQMHYELRNRFSHHWQSLDFHLKKPQAKKRPRSKKTNNSGIFILQSWQEKVRPSMSYNYDVGITP